MSPLLVAWALHYVKEAELGHSHFYRSAAYGKWAELISRIWYDTKNVCKRKHVLWLLFSFLSYNVS